MKKLISILLVMAMVSSFAMSIGCFADEKNLLVGDQSELLLNQENYENDIENLTENNCGLACKTKNFAGSAWKSLKEIPGTIKVLASSVIAGTVFFTKFYKTYKNEISRLNARKEELENQLDNVRQNKKPDLSGGNDQHSSSAPSGDDEFKIKYDKLAEDYLNLQKGLYTFNGLCNEMSIPTIQIPPIQQNGDSQSLLSGFQAAVENAISRFRGHQQQVEELRQQKEEEIAKAKEQNQQIANLRDNVKNLNEMAQKYRKLIEEEIAKCKEEIEFNIEKSEKQIKTFCEDDQKLKFENEKLAEKIKTQEKIHKNQLSAKERLHDECIKRFEESYNLKLFDKQKEIDKLTKKLEQLLECNKAFGAKIAKLQKYQDQSELVEKLKKELEIVRKRFEDFKRSRLNITKKPISHPTAFVDLEEIYINNVKPQKQEKVETQNDEDKEVELQNEEEEKVEIQEKKKPGKRKKKLKKKSKKIEPQNKEEDNVESQNPEDNVELQNEEEDTVEPQKKKKKVKPKSKQ